MPKRPSVTLKTIPIDRYLLVSFLLLLGYGLLMVTSASMVISDRQYDYPFHYTIHQAIYISLGLLFAWVATRIPMKLWLQWSMPLLLLAMLALCVVLIPGIGHSVNGSRRWVNFGVLTFQVSEAAKFCVILYIASYLSRYQNQVQLEFRGFLKPMLLLGVIAFLLLLEPNFGAVSVVCATVLAMLFLAGVRLWPFSALLGAVLVGLGLLAVAAPYRLERLTSFMDPWHHAFSSGYQLTQSLIAFGRGGWFGVGLGNSIQKLFYLPEAHTDFLFAVIGEELGFFGELLLIGLFVLLISRIIKIARRAQAGGQLFPMYIAYGVAICLGLQAFINMGVNIGLLPTKGLTLPFISYGGSSMLIDCVMLGLVARIHEEVT